MEQFEFKKMVSLLERYKISLCKGLLAKDSKGAAKAAEKIGFPVVLKVISRQIVHKTDAGGVITGINDSAGVEEGFEKVVKGVKKKFPRAKIEGILVQKQHEGEEIIVGMKRDSQFGPVVMFGLGGVFVEVLKDVSFRICPVDRKMAGEMIAEVKGFPILKGVRGKKGVNIEAIADIVAKVSKMAMDKKDIAELDLNPVMVDEKKAYVADVRMMMP
jgi:acyl-CoA synthetase (NDP forming)